jgi:dTDP-4-dehydrorhamnose 3,5-epimerase
MMFEKIETNIDGCFELIPRKIEDPRGSFIKTYHRTTFEEQGLETDWQEEYYSVSHKGVLRGMHFQLPPHDHFKMVYCTSGEVLDVILDLRVGSQTYGTHTIFQLNGATSHMIYIPKGCAHGFYTLSDQATMIYKASTTYAPAYDAGVLWNSVGIPWPVKQICISDRDKSFPVFAEFKSPFHI